MKYLSVPLVIVLVFVGLGASGAAQKPSADSEVTCRIIADDGTAVARATVRLTGSDGPGVRIGITDTAGDVTFTGLPAGSFSVSAAKTGYVTTSYGSKRPGSGPAVPIALASGQRSSVTLTMFRGSAISGRITDLTGRPLPQVSVQAIPVRPLAAPGAEGGMLATTTDSRGSYRLFGLAPGDYVLLATPPEVMESAAVVTDNEVAWALRQLSQSRSVALQTPAVSTPPPSAGGSVKYCPMYFPGTTTFDDAARITLGPGEAREDVRFVLQLTRTVTVTGRIVTSSAQTVAGTELALVPSQGGLPSQATGLNDSSIRRPQSGTSEDRFALAGVVPGRYTLYARWDPSVMERATGPSARTLWGKVELQVGAQDLSDVIVTLEPGPRISGSVTFDPQSTVGRVDRSNVKVALTAPAGIPPIAGNLLATVASDGSFTFPSIIPWKYGLKISPETPIGPDRVPWILKSATSGVDDLADKQIELHNGDSIEVTVTLTSRESEIAGVLLDAAGRPTAEFAVVVLSANRTFWTPGSRRVRATQPATDGAFRFVGLPSGEYDIVGVAELDRAALIDPAYLEQLQTLGFRLSLADGERRMLNLKIAGR